MIFIVFFLTSFENVCFCSLQDDFQCAHSNILRPRSSRWDPGDSCSCHVMGCRKKPRFRCCNIQRKWYQCYCQSLQVSRKIACTVVVHISSRRLHIKCSNIFKKLIKTVLSLSISLLFKPFVNQIGFSTFILRCKVWRAATTTACQWRLNKCLHQPIFQIDIVKMSSLTSTWLTFYQVCQ